MLHSIARRGEGVRDREPPSLLRSLDRVLLGHHGLKPVAIRLCRSAADSLHAPCRTGLLPKSDLHDYLVRFFLKLNKIFATPTVGRSMFFYHVSNYWTEVCHRCISQAKESLWLHPNITFLI